MKIWNMEGEDSRREEWTGGRLGKRLWTDLHGDTSCEPRHRKVEEDD
jgi:hypothetical protein